MLTIWVMRHAEKPDDPGDPDLSQAGRQRAKALVTWFPQAVGVPDLIVATAVSKHSARPVQTVQKLAKSLGLAIDSDLADQEYGVLAERLLAMTGRKVLVCWHHGNIPNLMHALGAADGSYPDPWQRDVFNLVLTTVVANGAVSVTTQTEPF